MIKLYVIDKLIINFLFLLLLVDMINGFMMHNNIILPISIAQIFKLTIIILFITRLLLVNNQGVLFYFILFFILLIPSVLNFSFKDLFKDVIKIFRYLMPVLSFFFFKEVFLSQNKKTINLIFKLVLSSYVIFVFNILLKYIGLGYPMYTFNNVGSKGYFYAGNETSAVLIILSSILAYKLWHLEFKKKYFVFILFNVFVGLTISSKTGVLGVFLVGSLIPLLNYKLTLSLKKIKYFFVVFGLLLPVFAKVFWFFYKSSKLSLRINYFWDKLDFITFIFSHRNVFFKKMWNTYSKEYSFVEKLIGVGQQKYELLNKGIIEIDIIDFFFAYGIVGVIIFLMIFSLLLYAVVLKKKNKINIYAKFVYLMIFILLGISTIAGHVFGSGMAAIFIGLLFSLMYYKKLNFTT